MGIGRRIATLLPVLALGAVLAAGAAFAGVKVGSKEWAAIMAVKIDIEKARKEAAEALDKAKDEEAKNQLRHVIANLDKMFQDCEDALKEDEKTPGDDKKTTG